MAPDVKLERATRSNVLRANPVQAGILKNAYALSDIATPEQLKALSQATNLPEKWIHQWFGRQRVKDRKSKSKAASSSVGPGVDASGRLGSTSLSIASTSVADLSTSISASSVSSASMLVPSNPDTILSAQEILQVKQEHHDSMPSFLLSEPLPVPIHAPAPPPEIRDTSEALTAISSVSLLSSAALDRLPHVFYSATSSAHPKRKRKASQGLKQDQAQNANNNPKAPAAQRKTRRRGATLAARIKAEFVEPSVENITSPSIQESILDTAGGPSTAINSNTGRGTRAGTRPSAAAYNQLLPMIAPPRRSSFSRTSNTQGSSLRVPKSTALLTSTSDNRDPTSQAEGHNPLSDSSLRNAHASARSALRSQHSKSSTIPRQMGYLEGRGPVFRTAQFHNQGPWTNTSSSVLISSRPASNVVNTSGRTRTVQAIAVSDPPVPPLQYLYEWPDSNCFPRLAPAFDWESHDPPESEVPISAMASNRISQCQQSEGAPQAEANRYISHEYRVENDGTMSIHPVEESSSGQISYSPLELSGFDSFLTGTVLDPLLAPLKHLTDILENFRDKQGTYMPLMQEEQRGRLMGCLLDERLAERSPFQAAMGLSLLSKLGVEWEV